MTTTHLTGIIQDFGVIWASAADGDVLDVTGGTSGGFVESFDDTAFLVTHDNVDLTIGSTIISQTTTIDVQGLGGSVRNYHVSLIFSGTSLYSDAAVRFAPLPGTPGPYFAGGLSNFGTVLALHGVAVDVHQSDMLVSNTEGGYINGASGVRIGAGTTDGRIYNTGTIAANGNLEGSGGDMSYGHAVYVGGQNTDVVNRENGMIRAYGVNAAAVYLDVQADAEVQNRGYLISMDGIAVDAGSNLTGFELRNFAPGLVKGGGGIAIQGGAGDDIVLNAGTIEGIVDLGGGNDLYDGTFSTGGPAFVSGEVLGGQGNDTLTGWNDVDRLNGGDGDDRLSGLGGNDILRGFDGNDTIFGGMGDDQLRGNRDDDLLDGGQGADSIDAGGGLDTLIGGAGNDTLTGGGQADLFVFAAGDGADVITDFTDGVDQIDLTAFGIASFADVLANSTFTGSAMVVNLWALGGASGDVLEIQGLTPAGFDASDFVL